MLARGRFIVEIIEACRAEVGPDFPILLRWSQWKQQDFEARLAPTPQLLEAFLQPLIEAGVDAFHCSQRRFWEPEFDGSDLNLAGWVKKITGKPTITVGSISLDQDFISQPAEGDGASSEPASIDRLLEMLDRGDFDLVAVGRALIANPNWPKVVRSGDTSGLSAYSKDMLASLD
jgi:2,4-dienoyl-CoA reductase-like NADH-dependent reductase (Old Yellow Enzyme family)